MTAKEYLAQAYRLDQRINAKLEQVVSLNHLATKCTSTITGMPRTPNSSTSTMADVITKIIDLEEEINSDIDTLVDLKQSIMRIIKRVSNPEYQTLLELRYLCFKTWEQIAIDMNYGIDNIFKLHKNALAMVVLPETLQ